MWLGPMTLSRMLTFRKAAMAGGEEKPWRLIRSDTSRILCTQSNQVIIFLHEYYYY